MNNEGVGNETADANLSELIQEPEAGFIEKKSFKSTSQTSNRDSMSRSCSTRHRYDPDDPRNPRLRKPAGLAYIKFLEQCQANMDKVNEDTLKHWKQALQDESDRIQQELKSPKYQMWQLQRSSRYLKEQFNKEGRDIVAPLKNQTDQEAAITTGTNLEKERFESLLIHGQLTSGLINLVDNPGISPTALLAVGAGFASGPHPNDSYSQIEARTYKEAWDQIFPGQDTVSQKTAWFATMWSIGLLYQQSGRNIAETNAGLDKGSLTALNITLEYSKNLIASLKTSDFDTALTLLLAPSMEKSKTLPAEGKIFLLTVALALIVKLEIKQQDPHAEIAPQAFTSLLEGKINPDQNEVKHQLVFWIQQTLNAIPEEQKTALLNRIGKYIASKPKLEDILDQQKAFATLLPDNRFEQSLIDNRPLEG